jgi:hypothetical protein
VARIYRVVVRGQFADLDAHVRAALIDEAAEHDIFRSAFIADGSFTYDERLVAFNLRYEVREPDDTPPGDTDRVAAETMERGSAWLTSVNIPHKHLRAAATDQSTLWQQP